MAEFKEGQGIKTHRDNDVVVKLGDGQGGAVGTDFLTVAQPGDTVVANTNDYGVPSLMKDSTGAYCIPETDANCNQKVVIVDAAGARIHDNTTFSAVTASGGTSDLDRVVTNGTTVNEVDVLLSSPGCFKYELGLFDGVSTFTPYATFITQPASPTVCCKGICIPPIVGDGTLELRLRATNNDDTDNDAFATLCYREAS